VTAVQRARTAEVSVGSTALMDIFGAFKMFAISDASIEQAQAYAADPSVKYIEQDQFAYPA
jgi:hypothetical protein